MFHLRHTYLPTCKLTWNLVNKSLMVLCMLSLTAASFCSLIIIHSVHTLVFHQFAQCVYNVRQYTSRNNAPETSHRNGTPNTFQFTDVLPFSKSDKPKKFATAFSVLSVLIIFIQQFIFFDRMCFGAKEKWLFGLKSLSAVIFSPSSLTTATGDIIRLSKYLNINTCVDDRQQKIVAQQIAMRFSTISFIWQTKKALSRQMLLFSSHKTHETGFMVVFATAADVLYSFIFFSCR